MKIAAPVMAPLRLRGRIRSPTALPHAWFDFRSAVRYPAVEAGAETEPMRTTVAIIGGGLAGLHAAHLLLKAGIEFQLLEARNRFGGRILSVNGEGDLSADGFDLGPSWFWPDMHPSMARVVDGLGLQAFPQHTDGDVVVERSPFQPVQRFSTIAQEPRSMRLTGGTGAIVSALMAALPAERLHLGARVSRVMIDGGNPVLSFRQGERDRTLVARQVIPALPPRLLASTVDFEPALDGETLRRWRRTATWMAPHAKFVAIYDRPFWRESGLSGMAQSRVGPLVEIHDATLASGSAALFGFVGLDHRQRMELGEEAVVGAAIAQLVRLFGVRAGQPQATLFKDWTADAFTATEADLRAEDHPLPDPRPWISGIWATYLSLAGSETSFTHPGYLAGALDAAERAVAEVARRL